MGTTPCSRHGCREHGVVPIGTAYQITRSTKPTTAPKTQEQSPSISSTQKKEKKYPWPASTNGRTTSRWSTDATPVPTTSSTP